MRKAHNEDELTRFFTMVADGYQVIAAAQKINRGAADMSTVMRKLGGRLAIVKAINSGEKTPEFFAKKYVTKCSNSLKKAAQKRHDKTVYKTKKQKTDGYYSQPDSPANGVSMLEEIRGTRAELKTLHEKMDRLLAAFDVPPPEVSYRVNGSGVEEIKQ